MELINGIVLNSMLLLFPLTIYLIANVYAKTRDKRMNDLFFEMTLFSSIYLLFSYGKEITNSYPMIIFNIILLIAYLKKKDKTAILISIILIFYYHKIMNINYMALLMEYTLYYISYIYFIKNKKESPTRVIADFVFIKSFILSLNCFILYSDKNIMFNLLEILFTMSIFIFVGYLCLYLLEKCEKILDLNKAVSELEKEKQLRNSLFKITHEIKNPIAVCKGYLDMIDYDKKDTCEKYISIVKDQIDRTLILMDDFLDYTKVSLNKEEVDLYMLLEDSCDVVYPLLKKAKIKLNYNIPDKELYMNLDYNRMKQVIVNMFKNSIEARDNKKKSKYIDIHVANNKEEVTIKLKDNGLGMDKKTLKKVYDMFYTTKEKGTGLGVALSKEIIELHGGSLKYSSVKNKYTIVTIKLPIKKEKKLSLNNSNYYYNKA